MPFRESLLREFGYQRIASDAHAAQLLRRELKFQRSRHSRNTNAKVCFETLLRIKKGNWFKFVRGGLYYSTILASEVSDERFRSH